MVSFPILQTFWWVESMKIMDDDRMVYDSALLQSGAPQTIAKLGFT